MLEIDGHDGPAPGMAGHNGGISLFLAMACAIAMPRCSMNRSHEAPMEDIDLLPSTNLI